VRAEIILQTGFGDSPAVSAASVLSRTNDLAHDRAEELIKAQSLAIGRRTDRLFAWLFVAQLLVGIAAATWIAPTHPRLSPFANALFARSPLYSITMLGTLATLLPLVAIWRWPGARLTRYIVAVCQMIWAALLFQFSAGHTGSHFPVFGSLAILACYRDWRVLVLAALLVLFHNLGHGSLWSPNSQAAQAAWERLAFVLLEVAALVLVIRLAERETWNSAVSQARLEDANHRLDLEFRERTANYRQYTERLERIRDELRLQAEELQKARAEAEQANSAKSNLVATVSHEIRTPMTAILGYADVLLSTLTDAEPLKAARTIRRNSEYLLKLVDDILDLSKLESGKLPVEPVPCSPRRTVSDVVQLMQVRADAKGLLLAVQVDDAVPRSIVTDPMRLRQILLNLVSNAIKFSSHGSIRLAATYHSDLENPLIEFRIRDDGIGMTPRQIDKLFYPFVQGDKATSRLYGGSGLGLWISRRLANLLGGEIHVESAPGQGSTFILTIAAGNHAELVGGSTTEGAPAQLRPPLESLNGCRVLIVDDSPDNRDLASFIVSKSGAEVQAVEDGEQAVQAALLAEQTGKRFDAILMDVQMPNLDGFTATERLRGAGYHGFIVALTADVRPDQLHQSQIAGCNACLPKPIDASLLELLAEHVRPRLIDAESHRLA
jgi:signal transduction histidine kinase